MDEHDRHLEILRGTPETLKASLAGLGKALLQWTPAPGKWSIHEIVCHMRDMEEHAYLARYRRILAEERPLLPDVDGEVYALERDYPSLPLGRAVADWRRLRRECLKILGRIRGEQWERVGTHETAGELTLRALLARHAVGNDQAHLGQIAAIKTRHDILRRLAAAPSALIESGKGLGRETLHLRPGPSEWAIVEIACHLCDFERVSQARFQKMAFLERPALWTLDNDRVAAKGSYLAAEWIAKVREFRRRREDTLLLLRALPHASWQRTGVHPKRGEVTIEALAASLSEHDSQHIEKIRSIRSALSGASA